MESVKYFPSTQMAGTTFQNKKWTKMRDSEVMSLSEQLNLSGKKTIRGSPEK